MNNLGETDIEVDSLEEAEEYSLEKIAKSIIQIEKSCFYGDESERDRLKKIRDVLVSNSSKY